MPQSGLSLADATSAEATQAAVVAAARLMALPLLFPLEGSSVARFNGSNEATTGGGDAGLRVDGGEGRGGGEAGGAEEGGEAHDG